MRGKRNIWSLRGSDLRMFVFTPVMFVMAIVGILLCIIQDVILLGLYQKHANNVNDPNLSK